MKRNIARATLLVIFAAWTASMAMTAQAEERDGNRAAVGNGGRCSLATLNGNYSFSMQGFESPNGATGSNGEPAQLLPFAVMGVFTFDGAGNFSATYTDVSPGQPGPYVPIQGTSSGPYTVTSDCTGSLSITGGYAVGITVNLAIVGGGKEVFGINTTYLVIATADFKKQ